MTDEPITIVDPDDDPDAPPYPFRLNYRNGDGEREDADFSALGQAPYAWCAALLAAGRYDPATQSDALLTFFGRVLPDDHDRFFDLINNPKIRIKATTLQNVAETLLDHYLDVGPTRARTSGGPRKSPNGRGRSGRGSTGSSRVKASTSR